MNQIWALLTDPDWRPGPWTLLSFFFEALALASVPSVLLGRRGRPLGALTWLLVLLSAPLPGLLAWWVLGRRHLERPRARHRQAAEAVARSLPGPAATPLPFPAVLPMQRFSADAARGVFPAVGPNQAEVLVDAAAFYPALEALIRSARQHVHLLFYTFADDATGRRFRDLLVEAARAGVEVRLLYDAVGSPGINDRWLASLRAAGGQAAAFLPLRLRRRLTLNFRNHRKIAVADGSVALTGGLNVADDYLEDWHDLGLRLVGPAAAQLQQVFADDWLFATGENLACPPYFHRHLNRALPSAAAVDEAAVVAVVASGPDNRHNLTHDAFFLAITGARQRIWLVTPYFIPSPTLLVALRAAVYRGADVRILLPDRSDVPLAALASRAYYADLLDSGVRIFAYRPRVLHAKALIFDDALSVLGSANLDTRSFRLNFEASCFIHSGPVNAQLSRLFEADLAQSVEISREDVAQTSGPRRLLEAAAHLLSPLL